MAPSGQNASLHKGTHVVLAGKTSTAQHVDSLTLMSNASELDGKVVLVTGAGSGIGKHFAFQAAKLGAKLILGDSNKTALDEVAKEIAGLGGKTFSQKTDVTSWDQLSLLFEAGEAAFGPISHVVPFAGILESQALFSHDSPNDKPSKPNLDTIMVNLIGVLYSSKLAFYYLKKNPSQSIKSLTLIGSMASHVGLPTCHQYSASKHGVLGLAKTAFWDGKVHEINVNLICPWFVDTPLLAPITPMLEGIAMASAADVSASVIQCCTTRKQNGKIFCVDADGTLVLDHPSWTNGEDGDYGLAVGRAASVITA